jgi:hypothetical protein
MPKTITALFGLLLNMTGMLYAQQNTGAAQSPEDELFGLSRYSINYAWHIDLGKGNYLELELTDLSQLSGFQNMDSLLLVFLTDMKGFRDSLADPAAFKCIDYLVDTSGRKMVRIRQTKPASPAWLLGDEAPSLLRLQQDTVHLLLPAPPVRGTTHLRRNRLTLVINQYDELENLVTTGLNAKMRELGPMDNRDWAPKNGKPTLIRDPAISAKTATNYSAGHVRNYLSLDAIFAAQNYRNYFTPSVGLGATIGLQTGEHVHQIGLHWEPLFFFSAAAQGRPQTYRNDLLVFSYDYSLAERRSALSALTGLMTNISFGMFVHREGDYIPSHSFRLTAGSVKLMRGRFIIEPCLYFDDFFRAVTPGLRVCFKVL